MPTQSTLEATATLRRALEQTEAALAHARLDDLLAAAATVEDSLAQLRVVTPADAAGRRAIAIEADAARRALTRCRRLGTTLTDVVRLTFDARGQAVGYGPLGAVASSLNGRGLDARG
jgi:hypothetical protein